VALEVHLIGESAVIEILLFTQVLEIGDGEGESDPVRRWKYKWRSRRSLVKRYLLLIAKLLAQNNFLFTRNILDLCTIRESVLKSLILVVRILTSQELFWRTYWMFCTEVSRSSRPEAFSCFNSSSSFATSSMSPCTKKMGVSLMFC
jgi:hypothetical protein